MNKLDALAELAYVDGIDMETAVAVSGLPSEISMKRWLHRSQREDIWRVLTGAES